MDERIVVRVALGIRADPVRLYSEMVGINPMEKLAPTADIVRVDKGGRVIADIPCHHGGAGELAQDVAEVQ